MTSLLLDLIVAIVRAWTHVYTWNLESSIRDARSAEIASDLWEQTHAPDARPTVALHILGRMLLGIPDDIRWRFAQAPSAAAPPRFVLLATLGSVLVLATVWIMALTRTPPRPWLPPPSKVSWVRPEMSAPPPPPPPICPPVNRQPPCTPWP